MIKLILASFLMFFSINAFALEEKMNNEIDMFGAMIFVIPLTFLFYVIFIYYKNKKPVVKKSYASTNVIIDKDKYKEPQSNFHKKQSNGLDSITNVDVIPSNTNKVASAIVIDDLISDDGDMSGGGSSIDFDFDWD